MPPKRGGSQPPNNTQREPFGKQGPASGSGPPQSVSYAQAMRGGAQRPAIPRSNFQPNPNTSDFQPGHAAAFANQPIQNTASTSTASSAADSQNWRAVGGSRGGEGRGRWGSDTPAPPRPDANGPAGYPPRGDTSRNASNYRGEASSRGDRQGGRGDDRGSARGDPRGCWKCGELGHRASECPGNSRAGPSAPPAARSTPTAPIPTANTQAPTGEGLATLPHADLPSQHLILQSQVHETDNATRETLVAEMYKRGLRVDLGTDGRRSEVLTNFLKVSQRPNFIFVYKIILIKHYKGDDELKESDEDKAFYVKKKFDKQGLFNAIMAQQSRLTSMQCWVTDFDLIWSTKPLFDDNDYRYTPGQMNDITGTNPDNLQAISCLEARIDFHKVLDLGKTVGQLFRDSTGRITGDDDPAVLARGLNAMVTQHARNSSNANLFAKNANQFYDVGDHFTIQKGRIDGYCGFYLSVRPGSQQLLVNINSRYSPFIPTGITVQQWIHQTKARGKIYAALKGIKVLVSQSAAPGQTEAQRTKCITSIGKPLGEQALSSSYASSKVKTVYEYFSQPRFPNKSLTPLDQTHFAINTGHDPKKKKPSKLAIQAGAPTEPEWWPPEHLEIQGHPPYRVQLLGHQTSKMILRACLLPAQQMKRIMDSGLSMFGFNNDDFTKALKHHFGLQIMPELAKIACRYIKPPEVRYGGNQVARVQNASWNLVKTRLASTCDTQVIPVLDLSGLASDAGDDASSQATGETEEAGTLPPEFYNALQDAVRISGMGARVMPAQANLSIHDTLSMGEERMTEILTEVVSAYDVRGQAGQFIPRSKLTVVIAMPCKNDDFYATIKRVAELKMGLKTVCCIAAKMSNWWKRYTYEYQKHLALQHCANIALKINIKGECDNHRIDPAALRELFDDTNNTIADTIVLGADVTHPMGHCAPGCPSVAAVVGSIDDNFAQFPGSMRLQRGRQEVITEFQHMVKERLVDWALRHDKILPKKVLIYRDGVSESYYEIVRESEIPMVQEAYDLAYGVLKNHHGAYQTKQLDKTPDFKLTFVVVGKRHNTRFYVPQDRLRDDTWIDKKQNPNGNVTPGCVVEETVTHPYTFDFYLQSHLPLKGTGRAAHYFVLTNGMHLSADRLQNITHAFCYNYARATRGVSYCGPAYYADRLCDRGRAYIRGWLTDGDNFHADFDKGADEKIEDFRDNVRDYLYGSDYYREAGKGKPSAYGDRERVNPWHENLDNTMFYL